MHRSGSARTKLRSVSSLDCSEDDSSAHVLRYARYEASLCTFCDSLIRCRTYACGRCLYVADRSLFLLLVGLDWCDVLSGEVNVHACSPVKRDLFYVMDQVPILAFFAIYALLVQFWAEVYYNAVDKLSTLTDVVKPAIRWCIVVRAANGL